MRGAATTGQRNKRYVCSDNYHKVREYRANQYSFVSALSYDGSNDRIMRQDFFPIILGKYSPSQNGVVVSPKGIALCISGGGKGHDVDKPKILIEYD